MSLKIIFAGTPAFAAHHLKTLLNHHESIMAVLTQADRPAGRGQQMKISDVKSLALTHAIPVLQPTTLRDPSIQEKIKNFNPDLIIVVAYGLILPKSILTIPRLGCINVHASLLPKFRGASPIQSAILAGETKTGITLMQMTETMDTGDILLQTTCPISPKDTAETLEQSLMTLGAQLLLEALPKIENNTLTPQLQDETKATYTKKIHKTDARINWHEKATLLDQKIRAFIPWPIAYTEFAGQTVRIWQASPILKTHTATPGAVLACHPDGIEIATGDGVLTLEKLQWPGGKILPVAEILKSKKALLAHNASFV